MAEAVTSPPGGGRGRTQAVRVRCPWRCGCCLSPAVRLSCHSPDSELAWPSSRRWGQTGRGPQGPLAAAFSSGDPNAACPFCVRTETCVVRPLGPTSRPPALRLSADRAFPTRASSAGPRHGPSRSETLDAPGAAARGSIANTAHKTAEHAALSRAREAPAGRVGPGPRAQGPRASGARGRSPRSSRPPGAADAF